MTNRKFVLLLLAVLFVCLFCMGCISTDPQTGLMIEQNTEGGPPATFFYLDMPINFRESE